MPALKKRISGPPGWAPVWRNQRGQERHAAVDDPAPAHDPGDPGGELLRHRHRSLPGGGYAVASGAYDICLALGVEKLKDTGYGGLPSFGFRLGHPDLAVVSQHDRPGLLCPAGQRLCRQVPCRTGPQTGHGPCVGQEPCQRGAQPQGASEKKGDQEQVMAAPIIAHPLGLFDCCGVSDGAACAIVTTPEIAKSLGKKDLVSVKALQLALSSGEEMGYNDWDGDHFMTTTKCSTHGLQGSRHHRSPQGNQHDGSARLLFHHRTGHHGRSAHFRAGQGGAGSWTASTI
jgi:hypothetical protein